MMSSTIRGKREKNLGAWPIRYVRPQLVLFESRKKFAFLYCLATITGLFCVPGVVNALSTADFDLFAIVRMSLPLPIASLLVTAGTYILNDLVDADLDKANGKKRPIPSGLVSKKQALSFVALTFGSAILLTSITFSLISLVIISLMVGIGIMYSFPKIALMKRFVIKTASIAIFYILCALLGMTSVYNLDLALESPMQVVIVLLTLAIMVFISSTLNDMGDFDGDKSAGRRTIPIVIGKEKTIRLMTILAATVLLLTWGLYGAALATGKGSLIAALATTSIALLVLLTMIRMRKSLHNAEFMRSQHKKLFPLQMAMHPALILSIVIL